MSATEPKCPKCGGRASIVFLDAYCVSDCENRSTSTPVRAWLYWTTAAERGWTVGEIHRGDEHPRGALYFSRYQSGIYLYEVEILEPETIRPMDDNGFHYSGPFRITQDLRLPF